MEKNLIRIDDDGKIIAVINTNDPTLEFTENEKIIDITKYKKKKDIIDNHKYFKFKTNKIVELSSIEKEEVDKESEIKKPVNLIETIIAELKKLNDRIDKIEKLKK